jgi:hypothetical protein
MAGSALGNALSDQWFAGGRIKANVTFRSPTPKSACDIIIAYNPATRAFVSAGISNDVLFAIRNFNQRWNVFAQAGDPGRLIQRSCAGRRLAPLRGVMPTDPKTQPHPPPLPRADTEPATDLPEPATDLPEPDPEPEPRSLRNPATLSARTCRAAACPTQPQ